jgi:hypothetical protein
MTEAECRARLYGGPREIVVIRPGGPDPINRGQIRRLLDRSLGRRDRKAA